MRLFGIELSECMFSMLDSCLLISLENPTEINLRKLKSNAIDFLDANSLSSFCCSPMNILFPDFYMSRLNQMI